MCGELVNIKDASQFVNVNIFSIQHCEEQLREYVALPGVAQWVERWPGNRKIAVRVL